LKTYFENNLGRSIGRERELLEKQEIENEIKKLKEAQELEKAEWAKKLQDRALQTRYVFIYYYFFRSKFCFFGQNFYFWFIPYFDLWLKFFFLVSISIFCQHFDFRNHFGKI